MVSDLHSFQVPRGGPECYLQQSSSACDHTGAPSALCKEPSQKDAQVQGMLPETIPESLGDEEVPMLVKIELAFIGVAGHNGRGRMAS